MKVIVETELLQNLSPMEVILYGILCGKERFQDERGIYCICDRGNLAEQLDCSKDYITQLTNHLIAKKYLKIKRKDSYQGHIRYYFEFKGEEADV